MVLRVFAIHVATHGCDPIGCQRLLLPLHGFTELVEVVYWTLLLKGIRHCQQRWPSGTRIETVSPGQNMAPRPVHQSEHPANGPLDSHILIVGNRNSNANVRLVQEIPQLVPSNILCQLTWTIRWECMCFCFKVITSHQYALPVLSKNVLPNKIWTGLHSFKSMFIITRPIWLKLSLFAPILRNGRLSYHGQAFKNIGLKLLDLKFKFHVRINLCVDEIWLTDNMT